jgi:hypothetical protein
VRRFQQVIEQCKKSLCSWFEPIGWLDTCGDIACFDAPSGIMLHCIMNVYFAACGHINSVSVEF